MTVRNVKKNLAAQQDLLPGVGPYQQVRRGVVVDVDGPAKSYIELWKEYCGEAYVGTFEDGFVTKPGCVAVSLALGKAYRYTATAEVSIPANSPVDATWVELSSSVHVVQVLEALRRSYAEAGYNVVGTFRDGFTLVNANDVGVDLATGKAFTGPAGTVAAGTNPASGGFVEVSDSLGCVYVSSFLSQYPASTTGAINAAIAYAQSVQRKLVFPRDVELTINSVGSYGDGYEKGIHFPTHNPYDQTKRYLVDFNGCKFKAGADNLIVIKISGSYGKYEGQYSVVPNGKTGVVGTAIAPEQISSAQVPIGAWGGNTATSVWNTLCKSYTEGCDVGHLFAVGGNTSNGLNSACYYNTIHDPVHKDCRIPIRFYGGYAAGIGLVNRNRIIGGGAYDYNATKKTQVGVSIEGGDTNRFFGYDFEGLPKAIKIVNMPGGDSVYNVFNSCMAESCAIHMEMDTSLNSVIGCGFDSTKVFVGGVNALPGTFLAADHYMPQSLMGFESIDLLNTRLKDGATLADKGKPPQFDSNIQPAAADLANVTNVHTESRYTYRVFNGICTLHVKLLFKGVELTSPINIALPETPNDVLYAQTGTIVPCMFPVSVVTSDYFVVTGVFSDESDGLLNGKKFLKIPPPAAGWSSGQFNKLNFEISYQIA